MRSVKQMLGMSGSSVGVANLNRPQEPSRSNKNYIEKKKQYNKAMNIYNKAVASRNSLRTTQTNKFGGGRKRKSKRKLKTKRKY